MTRKGHSRHGKESKRRNAHHGFEPLIPERTLRGKPVWRIIVLPE